MKCTGHDEEKDQDVLHDVFFSQARFQSFKRSNCNSLINRPVWLLIHFWFHFASLIHN